MLTVEVIEEDIAMRTLLSEWLSREGHVVRASSGSDREVRFDVNLVVVNVMDLPGEGVETVRRVKHSRPNAALIAISTQLNQPLAADSRQAMALGVRRLVPKPCSRGELLDAVAAATGVGH